MLKRLQRWICVLNHHGVLTIYFARVTFDVVIVHPRTMETGVNLKTARQPAIFILTYHAKVYFHFYAYDILNCPNVANS